MENNNFSGDSNAQTSSKRAENKRPLIFLGIGALNTLLDFTFYTLLTQTIFKDPEQIGLAGLVSGTFSLVCAFLTHSYITWRGSHVDQKTIAKFFVFTGFGMWALRPLLLSVFIQFSSLYQWAFTVSSQLGIPFSQHFIANTGAFGFMAIIVLTYNYVVYDRLVFSDKHTNP